jgi:hypothetical protein
VAVELKDKWERREKARKTAEDTAKKAGGDEEAVSKAVEGAELDASSDEEEEEEEKEETAKEKKKVEQKRKEQEFHFRSYLREVRLPPLRLPFSHLSTEFVSLHG